MSRICLAALALTMGLIAAATASHAQRPSSISDLQRRNLERRAAEAVIWGMPVVNFDLMMQEMLSKTDGKPNEVLYWGRPLDWRNQTLTPNPDTLYFMAFFDTKDGPMVLDLPAASAAGSFNGNIVNAWQTPLEDAGLLGADRGAGARYLALPPGHREPAPAGYIALPSDTYKGYGLVRVNLASHSDADVAKAVAYGRQIRVYPLAAASNPPPTVFTDAADVLFDSTIRYDASFFGNLDRMVQSEPWLERDRAMIDTLRSLGIEKGKPFRPDDATRAVLAAGAREAGAWLEARYDAGLPRFFGERSSWTYPATLEVIKAQQNGFSERDVYPVDDRGLAYSYAYVGIKRLGAGQMYLIAIRDKDGDAFVGGRTYRLRVPADPPVEQYWSVTAYDRQTHALIRNMPRPSRSSQIADLQKNPDGSVEVHFGPKAPAGKESNWVPTDPTRRFELMFRLYAPKAALFEQKWILPDVEKVVP